MRSHAFVCIACAGVALSNVGCFSLAVHLGSPQRVMRFSADENANAYFRDEGDLLILTEGNWSHKSALEPVTIHVEKTSTNGIAHGKRLLPASYIIPRAVLNRKAMRMGQPDENRLIVEGYRKIPIRPVLLPEPKYRDVAIAFCVVPEGYREALYIAPYPVAGMQAIQELIMVSDRPVWFDSDKMVLRVDARKRHPRSYLLFLTVPLDVATAPAQLLVLTLYSGWDHFRER